MAITADVLRSLLDYDPDTGNFYWRVSRGRGARVGNVAGTIHGKGKQLRLQIKLLGKCYWAHRLVWLHVHGEWPKETIDHVNGNPLDNRLSNLREATRSQNSQNTLAARRSTSGMKGVNRVSPLCGYSRPMWFAMIGVNGRRVYLGTFPSPEEAHAAYAKAAQEHFGEFDGLRRMK